MKKRCYILRHGQTTENALGIVQGSGIDSSLNDTGKMQAQFFYEYYRHQNFDLKVASGLQRTYQTIVHFEQYPKEIMRDQRLNEICWGEHEGRRGEPQLMEKYYRIIESWRRGEYGEKAVRGESALELSVRLDSFLSELVAIPFQQALICTHGRSLRVLICLMKGWPLSRMEEIGHNNTGLYIADYDNGKWNIVLENDSAHLAKMTIR